MEFIKLLLVFLVIILGIVFKLKLRDSMILAGITTILLFRIPFAEVLRITASSCIAKETLIVIANFILITFLQRIMEKRKLLEQAETALLHLSGSRKAVCMLAPIIIGFLPSMGAVNICGVIVDNATGEEMSKEEKTFVTSYYRHISESFSPTYNSILLALTLTSVATGSFVFLTLPMVFVLILLGYLFYLRKLSPTISTEVYTKADKQRDWKNLCYCFWPLFACIVLVIAFEVSILVVLPFVILASILVYRLSFSEVIEYAKSSVESRIILNTVILMIFKNYLTYTGVIADLPQLLAKTGLPLFLSFGLIVFFGTLISGANAMIVLIIPLAFSMMEHTGPALLMYLMCVSYAAMQLSPTHICLDVIVEHFEIDFGQLIKKTIPVILLFLFILCLYYWLLTLVGLY